MKELGEDWIIINWSPAKNLTNNFDRYAVFYQHCSVTDLQSYNVSRNESHYRINELDMGGCYEIWIKACNEFGCSNASNKVKAGTSSQGTTCNFCCKV